MKERRPFFLVVAGNGTDNLTSKYGPGFYVEKNHQKIPDATTQKRGDKNYRAVVESMLDPQLHQPQFAHTVDSETPLANIDFQLYNATATAAMTLVFSHTFLFGVLSVVQSLIWCQCRPLPLPVESVCHLH